MWSNFASTLPIHVIAALGLASSAAADYYIDNANNTVSYAASGTDWRTFSFATQNLTLALSNGNFTVDSSECHNQNYALAACTVQNNCQITFPFTGSGISLFVVHAGFQGISASLTIDGDQSVTATLPAPVPPSYQTPNVLLFDLQSLPSADHTATINVLDWENGITSLYFDYALINERFVELDFMSTYPTIPTAAAIYPRTVEPVNPFSASSTSLVIGPVGPVILDPPSTSSTTVYTSTIEPVNASSTSSTTVYAFISSTFTTTATYAIPKIRPSVSVGAAVGGACGGFAVLISIITAVIFLKKLKAYEKRLEESYRLDPFPTIPALSCDQSVSPTVNSQTAQKAQMRLMSRNMALNRSPRLSDGESSDFHILSTTGGTWRVPDVVAGPSAADPYLCNDFVIDCRREDGSSSEFRESLVLDSTLPSTSTVGHRPGSVPPPSYQTLDPRDSDSSYSTF